MSRRWGGWVLVLCGLGWGVWAGEKPMELAGYGALALQTELDQAGDGRAVFTCADAERAETLQSKLLADLTWDEKLGWREIELPGGIPARELAGYGAVVVARRDKEVSVVSAPTAAELAKRLTAAGLSAPQTAFKPEHSHPTSLDFCDNRSTAAYFHAFNVLDLAKGWQRYAPQVLNSRHEFAHSQGLNLSTHNGGYFGLQNLADGNIHTYATEQMIRTAARYDLASNVHFGLHQAPWWMRLRYPDQMVQMDPYSIVGWSAGRVGPAGGTHLSLYASDEAMNYSHRANLRTLQRLHEAAGDHLDCLRVSAGRPGDELGLHMLSGEFMEYSPAGQEGFRHWLRDRRGYDLAALGQRWYGDQKHYSSWDQVQIPSYFKFFGGFGEGTLNLLNDWRWRPDDPEKAADQGWGQAEYQPDADWTPVDLAPSQKQLFLFGSALDKKLRRGSDLTSWFRLEFAPAEWQAKQAGAPIYLVVDTYDRKPVDVYLNGSYLGDIKPKVEWCGPIALNVTGVLQAGRNVLCLRVPQGVIHGPVFLTTRQPARYPYLGRELNAQFVDLKDWQTARLIEGWKRVATPVRARDPQTPLMFVPGGSYDLADRFQELKREMGISTMQHTGGGSSYFPWWAGLGYVLGVYASSEEGDTIRAPERLSAELGWMLMNGYGHHNFYYDIWHYQQIEQKTGWLTKTRRLRDLLGKSTWVRPEVAVFRSAREKRYFPYADSSSSWDIGRGSLQAVHYNHVYVTETEIQTGLVRDYPVLFDSNSPVLDEPTLTAIEQYVRAGGIFIALNATGRHSLLEPDAWPISKLTGFTVVGERKNMIVKVPEKSAVLPSLAGKNFNGEGIAVNWLGINHAADNSVALKAGDEAGEALAYWEDGTIAVGRRKLGQGQIVVLGSTFWRNSSDRAGDGVALNGSLQDLFLSDLLTNLGVPRLIDCNHERVWARRFATKNGLQEWAILYNSGQDQRDGVAVSFPAAEKPTAVTQVLSGEKVDFTYENGQVKVAGLSLAAKDTLVLGWRRAGLAGAMTHWFEEKCKYAPQVKPTDPVKEADLPPAGMVVLEQFKFRLDAAEGKAEAWLNEPTAGQWKDAGYGFWDEMGYPAKGVGLYRTSFTVPPAWQGRRVMLAFASYDYPVFLEQTTAYLNGQKVCEYKGHPWANFDVTEITAGVHEGENQIAFRVEAKEVRGGYIGQVIIYPLEKLENQVEVKDGWRLMSDNLNGRVITLPTNDQGRYLTTTVKIPAEWAGREKDILLEFASPSRRVSSVVVNGRPINFNQSGHPYGNIAQVPLYPWIKPGEVNTLELWPYETIPNAAGQARHEQIAIDLQEVKLGLRSTTAP